MKSIAALLFLAAILSAQPPAPDVQISVNGARQADLPQGWPLLVHGVVMNSQRFRRDPPVDPVRLAPRGLSWTAAIKLTIQAAGAPDTTWNFNLMNPPDNPELNMTRTTMGNLMWSLSADATAALTPGTYRITAVLEVTDSDGWTGKVRSVPAVVNVIPVPSGLSPDQQLEHALLMMQGAQLAGDMDGAEAPVLSLLQSQPNSIPALQAMSALLEQRGLAQGAYIYASLALSAFYDQNPKPQEAPATLLATEARLRQASATQQ